MSNSFLKNLAIWLLIGFLVFLIVDFYNNNNSNTTTRSISYSNFLSDVKNGSVSSVQIGEIIYLENIMMAQTFLHMPLMILI